MKKKFLKVFSIVMCAFILAPNMPAVFADDSDDERSLSSSQSTNQPDNNCICIECCCCGKTFLQNIEDIYNDSINETEEGIGYSYNDKINCPDPDCGHEIEVHCYYFIDMDGNKNISDLGTIGGKCKEEPFHYSDDNDSSSSSQSTSQSDDNSSDEEPYNDEQEIDDLSKKTTDMNINKHEIYSDFEGDVFQKMNKKRQLVENGIKAKNYRYVSAFIANKFEKECKGKGRGRGGSFDFCTPFGEVKITAIKNGEKTVDCLVSCENNVKGDYGSLSKYLDKCTDLKLINIIYNYLSMYYDEIPLKNGEFDIGEFNKKVKKQFGNIAEIELTSEQRASFAVFCGVLMVAEPWRFKDGGGLSRGTIRTVYKFLKNLVICEGESMLDNGKFAIKRLPYDDKSTNKIKLNIESPFSFVFGESGPRGEALAVFAHKAFCSEAYKKEHSDTKLEVDEKKQWRLYNKKWKIYTSGKGQQLKQLDENYNSFENEKSIEDNRKRMEALNLDISDDEEDTALPSLQRSHTSSSILTQDNTNNESTPSSRRRIRNITHANSNVK